MTATKQPPPTHQHPTTSSPPKTDVAQAQELHPGHTISQLLRRASHSALALAPRDVLTLQRTVGNRAVTALLQRAFNKQHKAKIAEAGLTVEGLQTWNNRVLSQAELENLVFALDASQLKTATTSMSAADFSGLSGIGSGSRMVAKVTAAVAAGAAVEAAAAAPAPPSNVDRLLERGIRRETAEAFATRERSAGVTAVLADTPVAQEAVLIRKVEMSNKGNAGYRAIARLLTTDNPHGYDAAFLLDWVASKSVTIVRNALTATAHENRQTYLRLWLFYGLTASNRIQWQQLVRYQARLKDGAAALTVSQADVEYATSHHPPSRTGFLQYDFGGGVVMEIHTHWNENDKRISSMHVQYNRANGLEINKWTEFFADVTQAIVTAHNAAGGTNVPTTQPAGEPLTFP